MTSTPDSRRASGATIPYLRASAVVALSSGAATIELTGIVDDRAHWFAAVEYYDDAGGLPGDVVTPGAGTATFTCKTHVLPSTDQAITGGIVNGATNKEVGFSAAVTSIKAVLAGITTATHARLRVIGLAT